MHDDNAQKNPETGRAIRIGSLLLFVLVVALYAPSMRNGFVYDDAVLIVDAPAPRSAGDVLRVFTERHWKGLPYYRPVPRSTMVVQKYLHGDEPGPYHLFNALLMGLAAVAAFALLRSRPFGLGQSYAWIGAALFAAHPIASTTVYPIASGRETLIPGLLAIVAVWAWLRAGRASYGVALVFLGLALLSKEQSVVVPGLFFLADAFGLSPVSPGRDMAAWLKRYLPVAGVVSAYLVVRVLLFGGGGEHAFVWHEDPFGPLRSVLYAAQSILDPPPALTYEPRFEAWFGVGHVVVVLVVVVAFGIWTSRHWLAVRHRSLFWLGWFLISLAPTANVLYQEARFAERYVFLALLGAIGLVLTLATTLESVRARRVVLALGALLFVGCATVSFGRGGGYADERTFLQAWVRSDPRSAKALHGMGQYLYAQQDLDEAERFFEEALRHAPRYAAAHSNLGSLKAMRGELDEAEQHFRAAIEIKPQFAFAYNNLASILMRQGRAEDAVARFEQSLAIDPDDASVHYALGDLLLKTGNVERGRARLEDAVRLDPNHALAHFALGNVYLRNERDRAEFHFDRAALLDPDYAPAHNNLAIALAQRQQFDLARLHFERALSLNPDYVQAHLNFGNMLLAQGEVDRAIEQLERAQALAPDLESVRKSLEQARAVRDAGS